MDIKKTAAAQLLTSSCAAAQSCLIAKSTNQGIITAMVMRFILPFAAIFLFAIIAFAQIEGDVVDEKDKAIQGATISAMNSDGKIAASAKSDDQGFFALKGLKKGKYKVEATASGFQKAVYEDVEVYAESEKDHPVRDISNATRLQIIMKSGKS